MAAFVLASSAASFATGARVAPRAPARTTRRASLVVRAAQVDEATILAKYPDGGPVFAVSVDCTMGTNSTGIVMRQGDEGRPVVSAVRPGGTAKNKLKVGDVCLATSYTELVQDPDNKTLKWGTPSSAGSTPRASPTSPPSPPWRPTRPLSTSSCSGRSERRPKTAARTRAGLSRRSTPAPGAEDTRRTRLANQDET